MTEGMVTSLMREVFVTVPYTWVALMPELYGLYANLKKFLCVYAETHNGAIFDLLFEF